jgi:hypothetical protein
MSERLDCSSPAILKGIPTSLDSVLGVQVAWQLYQYGQVLTSFLAKYTAIRLLGFFASHWHWQDEIYGPPGTLRLHLPGRNIRTLG